MISVFIQASSVAWSGGSDLCMNLIDGKPAVYWTCKKYLEQDEGVKLTIIAPEFDRGGALESLTETDIGAKISIYYGENDSPLKRMVEASANLGENDCIIRADGLHFPSDVKKAMEMLTEAQVNSLDCMKFPDDFPIQFTADIYKVGAIRQLAESNVSPEFHVHPKHFMMANEGYRTKFCEAPVYSDDYLKACRKTAESVYYVPRLDVNQKKIPAGDQLSFHYEKALEFVEKSFLVLDIACGNGYGSRLIATKALSVMGCDLERQVVEDAISRTSGLENINFEVQDVTNMGFPDESFDMVVSMETIEHVDDRAFMAETLRVLKPGGTLLISTPQNALGHIPVNAEHIREYRLEDLEELVSEFFEIKKIIGIKQGRVVIEDSPRGANVMILMEKAQS